MYRPQIEPVPTIELPEPKLSMPTVGFAHHLVALAARSLRFGEPVMLHGERMIDAWHDFQDGKNRLIVAFRHAYGDDPQMMVYTFHHALPRAARKSGRPFRKLTHAHFIYGMEVPLWSGALVRWILPKAGAVSVNHVHMDSKGMNRIRRLVTDGDFPLALAPEGHVTYGSERIGEIETGTARFGFWGIEDLARQGRNEPVVILPVSTHYRYGKKAPRQLSRLIALMEKDCGLEPRKGAFMPGDFAPRLASVGGAILEQLRAFYGELSQKSITGGQDAILDAALAAAERILALTPAADDKPMARLYRIRTVGWDRIYRGDLDAMSPLRRELAGRETGEAWYAMRHMESSELLTYVDLSAIPADAPFERYAEIANNFYDIIERQKGGTLRNRANIMDKMPVIVPGKPVIVNDYLGTYRSDRKAALQSVTDELHRRFETCIGEYQDEYR